jgi:hypothetical protein
LWVDGDATHDDYDAACRQRPVQRDCAGRYRAVTDELSDRALMVNIGWAVAGLGALVATLDLLSHPLGEASAPRPSRWRVRAGPSQATLAWAW